MAAVASRAGAAIPPAVPAHLRPQGQPVSRRHALGFFAMVFGMFMAILDIQIVSSSIAEIQAGLGASVDEISWVQTAYLIAEVVMIPLSGFLSRVLSTRVLYTLSVAGFTLASVGCAMATSIDSMIVLRAIQGFVGGAMIPTTFATAYLVFPTERRAAVTVVIGLVATMAPTIGPTLGGYLTEVFSWHWLFLINVVPGLLVGGFVWRLLDIDKPDRSLLKGFDYLGLATMAIFLGTLEYVLEEGPGDDWFDSATIVLLSATCIATGVTFFWRVTSYRNPIVDLSAFGNGNFATGCIFSLVMGVGLYGLVYVLPLYLAQVRGLNSLQIGEMLFVTGLTQFLCAPPAGILGRRIDPRKLLALGFAALALSTWMLAGITAEWGFAELFWPQVLRGASIMFIMIPVNTLALGTLPPEKLKSASGLYNLMRNMGGAFGLAALNTLLSDRQALHWSQLAEWANPARPEVQGYLQQVTARLAQQGVADPQAGAIRLLGAMVEREAYVMSFADSFVALTVLFLGVACLVPLVRKPRPARAPGRPLMGGAAESALRHATPGRPPDPRKRAAVLEAARQLFLREGYDTSLEAIAAAAGVSRQTIYNLFGSKDELFLAILSDRAEQLTAPLATASEAVGPRAVLTELARRFAAAVMTPEAGQYQRALISSAQRFPKLARGFYEAGPAVALRRMAAYLAAEAKRNRLTVPDPELSAELFFGMLKGHCHIRLMLCGEGAPSPAEQERRIAYSVEAFLLSHAPPDDATRQRTSAPT